LFWNKSLISKCCLSQFKFNVSMFTKMKKLLDVLDLDALMVSMIKLGITKVDWSWIDKIDHTKIIGFDLSYSKNTKKNSSKFTRSNWSNLTHTNFSKFNHKNSSKLNKKDVIKVHCTGVGSRLIRIHYTRVSCKIEENRQFYHLFSTCSTKFLILKLSLLLGFIRSHKYYKFPCK